MNREFNPALPGIQADLAMRFGAASRADWDGNTVEIWRLRRRLLAQIFEILYRFGHLVYDPLTAVFFGPAWHNWRRTTLPFVGPDRVLDLACGTGKLLPELASRSRHVIGLDRSPQMLSRARVHMDQSSVDLVQGDAAGMPFQGGSFDTVVSTFPASFITRPEVLDQIAAALAPGGQLVVVASARFTRFQWRRPFIHLILRLAYGDQKSMNKWPDDLLEHPEMPGNWNNLRTPEGEAFVWVATRRA